MALKLYNSLSGRLEQFQPLNPPQVGMYNCGPTVYNYAHLGNWRSFIFADVLRRYLEYSGYKVTQIMNITDVGHLVADADTGEDKMEKSAKEAGQTPAEIAQFFEKAFLKDAQILNLQPASRYPRASEHIPEMIALVEKLLKNGYAYESNGSVYFDITKFPEYGQLSGNSLEQLQAGKRVEINPDKKNPLDFALWVYDPKHLMFWKSPWNDHGYPGWHLECSAMSEKYLGQTFDIHTGGEDNKFPHHECEIAQSTGANGCAPAKFWLHVKHLLVENEKMSKSTGNFFTLQDLLDKGYDPIAIRILLIITHYRQQLNFTFKGLEAIDKNLSKIRETWNYLNEPETEIKNEFVTEEFEAYLNKFKNDFQTSLDDDLNTAGAWAATLDLMKNLTRYDLSAGQKQQARELLSQIDHVWGLNLKTSTKETIEIPTEIQDLIDQRARARADKNWALSDELRARLAASGWQVEDTAQGQKVIKL